jgi:hypothetical protein
VEYQLGSGNRSHIKGGATIQEAQARADRDGLNGAAVFRYLQELEQRSEVVSIRQPGLAWEPFKDRHHLRDWWWRLPEPVVRELAADPDAPLSSATLKAAVEAGVPATSNAWWVDSESGPSGFYLPSDVRAYIRAVTAG